MPNFTLILDVVSHPSNLTTPLLLQQLVLLNDSLNAFPPQVSVQNNIQVLNQSAIDFRSTLSLRASVATLNDSLNNMPDIIALNQSLVLLQNFISTPKYLDYLYFSVLASNKSISTLPDLQAVRVW